MSVLSNLRVTKPAAPVGRERSSDRRSAIWVGVLWIMATVFPVLSISSWAALDDGDGILANAATHKSQLIAWTLLNLVGAVAAAGVAFMLYPILHRVADTSVKKGLALWYVGTRITEGGTYLVAVLATWAFLPLSRESAAAGAPDASHFHTTGIILQTTQDLALALAQSVFAIGAVMLYYLLLQSCLVPRWLSLWASSQHRCLSSRACRSSGRGILTPRWPISCSSRWHCRKWFWQCG